MRALFIDCNLRSIDPTRNFLLALHKNAVDELIAFGPGYTPRPVLERGLPAFCVDQEPFDVVIITETVMSSTWSEGFVTSKLRQYSHNITLGEIALAPRIRSDALALGVPVIGSFLRTDFHLLTDDDVKAIEDSGAALIGLGPQFCRIGTVPTNGLGADFPQPRAWAEMIARHPERDISLPMCVDDMEFVWSPLHPRRWNWAAPGANYAARVAARRVLRDAGIGSPWDSALAKALALTGHLDHVLPARARIDAYGRWPLRALLQASFFEGLAATRFVYTCPSNLGWPLRKYLEIPAVGSLLVCQATNSFAELGFVDGTNCIVAEPDELPAVHRRLVSDLDKAQAIASAGQQMVWDRHSTRPRAAQMRRAISAVVQGDFAGSEWRAGEFVVHRQGGDQPSASASRRQNLR